MASRSKKAKQDDLYVHVDPDRRSKKRRSSESEDEEKRSHLASPGSSKLQGAEMSGSLRSSSHHDHNKPAELFRKDLISAMKLPDTEPLTSDDYFLIADGWRQEWEKGVQVPVNSNCIPVPVVRTVKDKNCYALGDFKMPNGKMFHANQDDNYNKAVHYLTGMQQLAEEVIRYDLDDLDVCWLQRVNEERLMMGDISIHEWTMERVMEEFETQCHENMQQIIKTSEGLGIEYDENVICDVCRSPDSEDMNEMVFCDNCDICVHQACYGIQTIPEGSWLCRTCALGIQPQCILCPRKGGAMKSTRSGTKWTHVSCALWIPEVSIGCVEKMEPITKISHIPSSRWSLVCCLCRERTGACIQCSVKTCKTAFHVTCAFHNNLEMKTILDGDEEDVKLKAYCPKHSKKFKDGISGELQVDISLSPRKEYTQEEKDTMRQQKIQQLEDEFYTCIKVPEVATKLQLEEEAVDVIFQYWKLKRKVNFNKPLLTPKTEEADLLSKQQEDSLVARMKMFVHLRQDLERVRNLCYMVGRREKIRRQLYRMKEEIFYKQVEAVENEELAEEEVQGVVNANHGEDIYDHPEYIMKMNRKCAMSQNDSQDSDHRSADSDSVKSGHHSPYRLKRFKSGRGFGAKKDRYAHLRRQNRERPSPKCDQVLSDDVKSVNSRVHVQSDSDSVKDNHSVDMDSDSSRSRKRSSRHSSVDIKREGVDRTDGDSLLKAAEVENLPQGRTRTCKALRKNGGLENVLKEDLNGIKAEFTDTSESEDGNWPSLRLARKGSDSSLTSKSSLNGVNKRYNRLSLKSRLNSHNHRHLNGLHDKAQIPLDGYFKLAGTTVASLGSPDGSGDRTRTMSPVKSLLKGDLNTPHKEFEKKELCESFIAGHTSPLSRYRIPKKNSANKSTHPPAVFHKSEIYLSSPETRSAKKRMLAEVEAAAAGHLFDQGADEIGITRSSRGTSPDKEALTSHSIKRDLMATGFNDIHRKLRKRSSKASSECTRSEIGSIDFENNSECSATDSEASGTPHPRRRSLRLHLTDDESVDSCSLRSSRHSSQSKFNESRSQAWSVHS